MKHHIIHTLLIAIILSACAPSAESIQTSIANTQASYTATPAPTSTPQPTATIIPSPTKNLDFEYLSKFIGFMNDWGTAFSKFHDANTRITNEGIAIIKDTNFQVELVGAMTSLDKAAKQMATLAAPSTKFEPLQKKAESLQAYTETFTSLYLSSLSGNQASVTLGADSINKASNTFTEIVSDVQVLMKTISSP